MVVVITARSRACLRAPVGRVGRARESDLRLVYEGVSDKHAEILRIADGAYRLRDLGSEGGTFVNGVKIEGEQALHHGTSSASAARRAVSSSSTRSSRSCVRFCLPRAPRALWLSSRSIFNLGNRRSGRSATSSRRSTSSSAGVLILAQPDLGTTLVIVLVALTMMSTSAFGRSPDPIDSDERGRERRRLGGGPQTYQKDRVLTFLNPESDLAGAGYHQNNR